MVAYDLNGNELWRQSLSTNLENYAVITDLEVDGDNEVIANQLILDAASGTLVGTLQGVSVVWGAPATADMDLDGVQEIMIENMLFSHDGTLRWSCGTGGVGSFPHPVNADADPEGELLVSRGGQLTLCDDDGTRLWTVSHAGVYGAAMAVADFDNDGMQEYALAARNAVYLYEPDGSIRWSTPSPTAPVSRVPPTGTSTSTACRRSSTATNRTSSCSTARVVPWCFATPTTAASPSPRPRPPMSMPMGRAS